MAVSSFIARSLRLPASSPPPSASSSSLLLSHFHSRFGRRCFAQAVKLSFAPSSSRAKKKPNPSPSSSSSSSSSSSTSWDEAGSLFFASKHANAEDSSAEKPSGDAAGARSYGVKKEYGAKESVLYAGRGEKGRASLGKDGGRNGFSSGKERSTMRGGSDGGNFSRKQFSDVGNGGFDARRVSSKVKPSGFREQFSDYAGVPGTADLDRDQGGFRERFSGRGDQGSFRERFSGRGEEDSFRERFSGRGEQGSFRERFSNARGRAVPRNGGGVRDNRFSRNDMVNNSRGYNGYGNQVSTNSGRGRGSQGQLSRAPRKLPSRYSDSRGRNFLRKHPDGIVDDSDDEDDDSIESYGSYNEEDEEEEDNDEEDEEFPQAGDVIRYNDRKRNTHGRAHKFSDEEEDEEEEEEEEEEEDNGDDFEVIQRNVGWRKESSLPQVRGEVIYGVAPVYAALRIARRDLFCLYVQVNMPIKGGRSKRKDKRAVEWILKSAIEKGLEVKEISKHDLNMLADNRPHQGLVLDASPLELINVISLDAPWGEIERAAVWVALDEVQDPQNFGAILRSAYFLGAEGVVVCAKNSAPLSAVVSKASAGALEVMELRSCKNMMKFLEISAKNGWRVVGATSATPNAIPVRDLPRGLPTILVLGGEGKGLRTNVKMACKQFVCIPGSHHENNAKQVVAESIEKPQENDIMSIDTVNDADADVLKQDLHGLGLGMRRGDENFTAVESLNVSVAAGILLHELLDGNSRHAAA